LAGQHAICQIFENIKNENEISYSNLAKASVIPFILLLSLALAAW
jgi:hypothetical protein